MTPVGEVAPTPLSTIVRAVLDREPNPNPEAIANALAADPAFLAAVKDAVANSQDPGMPAPGRASQIARQIVAYLSGQ